MGGRMGKMRVRIPKAKGQLLVVDWLDACGYINEDLEDAKPAPCTTVGWLKAVKPDHIILATSRFEDGSGDWTVLPIGMLTQVKEVDHKCKCAHQNHPNQQQKTSSPCSCSCCSQE
tara:strand:+ start:230 stop:577 length:348 start_codon:yes stop_codon:yes gene_type:complete